MKGKPWPADDEKKLKGWFTSGITDLGVLAFSFDANTLKRVFVRS